MEPKQSDSGEPPLDPAQPRWRTPTLYPQIYVWFVLFASLDIMTTALVLHSGGREVNMLAAWILDRYDLRGLVAFKFILVLVIVGTCEIVGRRRGELGRRLAEWAVAITAVPVVVGLAQLLDHAYR